MGKPSKKIRSAEKLVSVQTNDFRWTGRIIQTTIYVLVGYIYFLHISTLFERNTTFSHLSTMERELSFRTEQGLYYSYFRDLSEAPSFMAGVGEMLADNKTEYPYVINTLQRFNLYPEVFTAAVFRVFRSIAGTFKWEILDCYEVTRGSGMPPVRSCEGLGEPAYFYSYLIFVLHGFMMACMCYYGTFLSGSVYGGLLTSICVLYNHSECTRIMYTPPLRESFSYPFCILQTMLVTRALKKDSLPVKDLVLLAVVTLCFLLPWQFGQFALCTQVFCLAAVHFMGQLRAEMLLRILAAEAIALTACFILMFGNLLLLTSFYAAALVTLAGMVHFRVFVFREEYWFWSFLSRCWFMASATLTLKTVVGAALGLADDSHIWDILKSKFSDFKTFDSQLYTCATEFDFLELESILAMIWTGLLPAVLLIVVTIIYTRSFKGFMLYHVLQLLAYSILAVLIMRLKLFMGPFLCLTTSFLASEELFGDLLVWGRSKWRRLLTLLLIAVAMSPAGISNLNRQWRIHGEFSNFDMEETMNFVRTLPQDAVLAGAMPTMATVKLVTGRAIVNHPHYEDARLRETTKTVYAVFSRRPVEDVHNGLLSLGVTHFLLEDVWCHTAAVGGHGQNGCAIPQMFDLTEPQYHGRKPTCETILSRPEPLFTKVFHRKHFNIFKVNNI